jgi:hypothetical protein
MIYMSNTNCKDNKYKYMMAVEECFFVFMLFVLSFELSFSFCSEPARNLFVQLATPS